MRLTTQMRTSSHPVPAVADGEMKMKQQARQRQANFRLYSETMRKEKRHTQKGLLLKLLVLPLAMMLIGTALMAMTLSKDKQQQQQHVDGRNNKNSNANNLFLDHLSSFSSGETNLGTAKQQKQPKQQSEQELPLPKWITDYVQWHQEVRAKFPGDDLFTKEDAPKLLVRTCLGLCGGLHDRLGQLPWDIYLAMRLKRVLLIAWQRPGSLEHFLQPPIVDCSTSANPLLAIDWRIPESQHFGFDYIKRVRSEVTELFDENLDRNPGEGNFWKIGFEKGMVRAGAPPSPWSEETFEADSKFVHTRILRHRLLGHLDENILEERLEKEGYYKDEPFWKPSDLHKAPTFGAVWKLFFRPSPGVKAEIVQAMNEMDLLLPTDEDTNGNDSVDGLPPTVPYKAVHCRVRHPKAHPAGVVVNGKYAKYPADKTGLPWVEGGPQRAFALETANKALVCARDAGEATDTNQPVYFLSDSNDLVTHVSVELMTPTYLQLHGSNSSWVYPPLLETVRAQHIVSRDTTLENAHIDRQKGRKPPAYYATFVDLYLAMKAKCVIYGIGYYAAFAAKLSGTDCAYLYAKESWGAQVEKSARICPNHDDSETGRGKQ